MAIAVAVAEEVAARHTKLCRTQFNVLAHTRTPRDVPEIMSLEKQVNNTGEADENENPTKNGRHKKRATVRVEIESKVGSDRVLFYGRSEDRFAIPIDTSIPNVFRP